ncbi:MAG: flagellar biosynthesis anti-sigma factor FlgM [Janthinobacterium lividum]
MTNLMDAFVAYEQGNYRGDIVLMNRPSAPPAMDLSCVASQEPEPRATAPGKRMRPAKNVVDQDPSGVRHEKVAALKAAIQNGTYHVSAEALADKLIESLLR